MKETIIHTQYCGNNSILVVIATGAILRLNTPFKVQCIEPIGKIALFSFSSVEEVLMTTQDRLIYLINGQLFYHSYFIIITPEEFDTLYW